MPSCSPLLLASGTFMSSLHSASAARCAPAAVVTPRRTAAERTLVNVCWPILCGHTSSARANSSSESSDQVSPVNA